jgi:hypothetical protein
MQAGTSSKVSQTPGRGESERAGRLSRIARKRGAMFHDADPAVVAAANALRNPDPCGDDDSVVDATALDHLMLPTVTVPVLLLYGSNDALFPPPAGTAATAAFRRRPRRLPDPTRRHRPRRDARTQRTATRRGPVELARSPRVLKRDATPAIAQTRAPESRWGLVPARGETEQPDPAVSGCCRQGSPSHGSLSPFTWRRAQHRDGPVRPSGRILKKRSWRSR